MIKPKKNIPVDTSGSIAWMIQNPIAANLLMGIFIIGGIILATQMKQEVFPEFELDIITISVSVPGSTPEEIEKSVVLAIEEIIESFEEVEEFYSTSREGSASIQINIFDDTDPHQLLQEIKTAIDRIQTFPQEAEPPQISLKTTKYEVIRLILTGNVDHTTLRKWADIVDDELSQDKNITIVELGGIRDHEIIVEVPQNILRRHGLTIEDIASKISSSTLEKGSGSLRTTNGDIMLRLNERKDYAREFETIPIITDNKGSRIVLSEIATITDGFEDSKSWAEFNGKDAIFLSVFRVGDQRPENISKAVQKIVDKLNSTMPGDLHLDIIYNSANTYQERSLLLLSNALQGIILVFICLSLFLEYSLAFWVSLGVPVSILGSFLFLSYFNLSLNMISMFAFIVTLGIVVDDAIVIGENIRSYQEKGLSPLDSAIIGTKEVAMPIFFSILTNIIAFLPILFVPGTIGKVWGILPIVVCSVFTCSLIESCYILPAHLAYTKISISKNHWKYIKLQEKFSRGFVRFSEIRIGGLTLFVIRNRYTITAISIAILCITSAYIISGRIGFYLSPRTESDIASTVVTLPIGASKEQINIIKNIVVQKAEEVVRENGGSKLSRGIYTQVIDNSILIYIYLKPSDIRPISTKSVVDIWRDKVGILPGIDNIIFESDRGGPGSGKSLTIRILHRDANILEKASHKLAKDLSKFSEISDIDSGTGLTKRQFEIKIRPIADQLGLTAQDIATQVRNAFEGSLALRQQRNQNEVTVRVRLPEKERRKEDALENLVLQTNSGQEVLLRDITEIIDSKAHTYIHHANGRRTATVSANIHTPEATNLILQEVTEQILPNIQNQFPGMSWELAGKQADLKKSTKNIIIGLSIALLCIYVLLAIPFKSYTQPFIVMISIPFGMIGAILGHLIMGYSLSLISIFGIVALSGIVINNALILLELANRRKKEGVSASEAIRQATIQRFRPIFLTTLTTFTGLMPIMFETSRQARQLIPIAISLGFGIIFAMLISLILVPALYIIFEDITKSFTQKKYS